MSIMIEAGQLWRWNGNCTFNPSMYTVGKEYAVLSVDGRIAYVEDDEGSEANDGRGHQWLIDDPDFRKWFDLVHARTAICKLGTHIRSPNDNCTICGATPEQVNDQARAATAEAMSVLGIDPAATPTSRVVEFIEQCAAKAGLRIYLSGPMSGYPNGNYPLFNIVSAMLRRAGHTVYNPAEFQHDEPEFPLRRAFAAYAKFICEEADAIVLLPSWEQSSGVSAELALAKNCKLRVIDLKDVDLLISA